MLPVFFYLTLSFDFAILLNMKRKKDLGRRTCRLCGAKRYLNNLDTFFGDGHEIFECKNSDMCVLKMAYNKKKKKLCVGKK